MRLPERVADLAETGEAGIRLGGVGEPAQHDRKQSALDGRAPRDSTRECLEVTQGSGRIGVAERLEPLPGRLRRQPGVVTGQPGNGGQQRAVEELLVQTAYLPGMPAPGVDQLPHRLAHPERMPEPPQILVRPRQDVDPAEPLELQPVSRRLARRRVGSNWVFSDRGHPAG